MPVHAVTLELPDEVYQQAQRVAHATRRPVEEIVSDWIRPPVRMQLLELDRLSDHELRQAAREVILAEPAHRLQELLTAQRQRTLSEEEQREAIALVEQEDFLTLRKARALFLLKQRGILPDNLGLDS
jgi:predicted transcriptional regulator